MKPITKSQAIAMIKDHDVGKAWSERQEPVSFAANTGDAGWRHTFNNGERDVFCVEYPKARYTTRAYALA